MVLDEVGEKRLKIGSKRNRHASSDSTFLAVVRSVDVQRMRPLRFVRALEPYGVPGERGQIVFA